MEDKECFVKYIEIVPLDNFNNCSDVTDIKQEPDTVKVYVARIFIWFLCFSCIFILFYVFLYVITNQNTVAVLFCDLNVNSTFPLCIFLMSVYTLHDLISGNIRSHME